MAHASGVVKERDLPPGPVATSVRAARRDAPLLRDGAQARARCGRAAARSYSVE